MLVECCLEVDIRIRIHTNKRGIEQKENDHSKLSVNLQTLLSMIIIWITITIVLILVMILFSHCVC